MYGHTCLCVLRSTHTWFAALCRGDCVVLCCASLCFAVLTALIPSDDILVDTAAAAAVYRYIIEEGPCPRKMDE